MNSPQYKDILKNPDRAFAKAFNYVMTETVRKVDNYLLRRAMLDRMGAGHFITCNHKMDFDRGLERLKDAIVKQQKMISIGEVWLNAIKFLSTTELRLQDSSAKRKDVTGE